LVFVVISFTLPIGAKGPVVKLVLSGPDLVEPVEITDPDAIDVIVYGATFVDHERGPQDRRSSSPIAPYEIQFYVDVPRQGVTLSAAASCIFRDRATRGIGKT
jgi:hypothetical protein